MLQSNIRILMVEDDAILGQNVQQNLQKKNFNVTLSTDGDDAWRLFLKNNYDICLLDISIPGTKDGMTLAKNIRNENKEIPIILVSPENDAKRKSTGNATGADDYIARLEMCKVFA